MEQVFKFDSNNFTLKPQSYFLSTILKVVPLPGSELFYK